MPHLGTIESGVAIVRTGAQIMVSASSHGEYELLKTKD